MKLALNPLKANNFAKTLLSELADSQFLGNTIKNSKEPGLEIISYWISKEEPDDSRLVKELNDALKKNDLSNSCIKVEENDGLVKISMVHEEVYNGIPFEDLKDETRLSNEHREQIYNLITKKCLHQARFIGHYLLPYDDVSAIYYDDSKVKVQLEEIMTEVRAKVSPSWACLKALLNFIGKKQLVKKVERDILKVQSTNQVNPAGEKTYPMNNSPHGVCLVINNSFKNTKLARHGTEMDEQAVKHTFESLNFKVIVYPNKSANEMKEVFRYYAEDVDHANYDCFVSVILSHGSEGHVSGNDDEEIKITEIRNMFGGDKCKSLIGKPKLFFIQACQGGKVNIGNDSPLSSDAPPGRNGPPNPNSSDLPNICDFLFFMSSVSETVSWRAVDKGSWFIQTLCEIFNKSSKSLLDNLMEVNRKISEMEGILEGITVKQMSDINNNSLRFPIFLKRKV